MEKAGSNWAPFMDGNLLWVQDGEEQRPEAVKSKGNHDSSSGEVMRARNKMVRPERKRHT